MRPGFVIVHEPLLFAVCQEVLASEQRATRTALPPDARWSRGQVYAKSPAKMNLTNHESD
jgi:hypothetical protein